MASLLSPYDTVHFPVIGPPGDGHPLVLRSIAVVGKDIFGFKPGLFRRRLKRRPHQIDDDPCLTPAGCIDTGFRIGKVRTGTADPYPAITGDFQYVLQALVLLFCHISPIRMKLTPGHMCAAHAGRR